MMMLEVEGVPPSPNVVKRKYRNPHAYRRLRLEWEVKLLFSPSPHHRSLLRQRAKQAGKLWVQMTLYHSREYDTDNLLGSQKIVLDALVNIGFLRNDSISDLQLLPAAQVKSKRKDAKTIIKIGVVD